MKLFERITKYQWVILTISLIAVLAMVGMNLAILTELREQRLESERENQRIKLDEFANQIRYEIIEPLLPLWKQDLEELQREFPLERRFPDSTAAVIEKASRNPLFSGIYFTEVDEDPCTLPESRSYRFDAQASQFLPVERVPQEVCDAVLLSKSRGRVFVEGSDTYRWNAKISFDTHRSFTLAFLDVQHRHILGHLTFLYDPTHLVDGFLAPRLTEAFGDGSGSGLVVWLRDWTNSRVLASSNPSISYDRTLYPIDLRQEFPDFLDYWSLHASFQQSPSLAGMSESHSRNLYILLASMLVLVLGIGTMFVAARRERALSNRQSEFLSNVTHELKTPLSVLQAAGENLSDGRVENAERVAAYGVHIQKESRRLRSMIDRLLDVAKSEGGLVRSNTVSCNLGTLVEEFASSQRDLLREQDVNLEVEVAEVVGEEGGEGIPSTQPQCVILADPEHLLTILSNLVDNAVKYSPNQRHIRIACRAEKGWVHLSVTDSGVGIPKRAHKRIFEKFHREEQTLTATTKGHGLGLAIVKDLVQLNNGRIHLESSPGEGSTFTVSFRQHRNTHPAQTMGAKDAHVDGAGSADEAKFGLRTGEMAGAGRTISVLGHRDASRHASERRKAPAT